MKRIVALTLALAAAACGSAQNASEVSGRPDSPILQPRAERALFPLQGAIGEVAVKSAEAPAQGIWTEISVDFEVDCSVRFETASVNYARGQDGKIKIFAAAYASDSTEPRGPLTCQAFSIESRKLTLPGFVGREQLELVNIATESQDLPNDTIAVRSASRIEVTGTRSLCPEGMICAFGGTIVSLKVELQSCANDLGPVAFAADQTADGGRLSSVALAVHAVDIVSELSTRVDCAQTFVDTEITLPNVFVGKEPIELTILN